MISVNAKATTNAYRSIDVQRWNREGLLTPHRSFVRQWSRRGEVVASIGVRTKPDQVILTYCRRNGHKDWSNSYTVDLDWTPCNFGGKRPWFLCPANGSEPGSYCKRREAVLYGGAFFACRHCCQLAYPSPHISPGRLAAQAFPIRFNELQNIY